MLNIEKCLVNLCVNIDLPPPGGAATAINIKLSNSLKYKAYLSYTPFKSTNYLNSSIGGWAPHFSIVGILTSSTSINSFFPGGGVNIILPFFLY